MNYSQLELVVAKHISIVSNFLANSANELNYLTLLSSEHNELTEIADPVTLLRKHSGMHLCCISKRLKTPRMHFKLIPVVVKLPSVSRRSSFTAEMMACGR